MQIHSVYQAAAILFAAACLQGCSAPATPAATPTPTVAPTETGTATITSTFTHRPTTTVVRLPTKTLLRSATRTPAATRDPALPTPACAADGWWGSAEVVETTWTTTPFPMVQFHVGDCAVTEFILVVYPAKGKLFEADLKSASGAIQNGSFSTSFDNPKGAGALSIFGKFSSNESFQGSLMFSAGFLVDNYTLPEIVTIPFSAILARRD